jgi:HEAT repeat protein
VAVIQALAALGSEDRTNLVALLRDPDVAIRREAVAALGRLGPNAGATSALVDRLRTDPSADVRRQAAYSLGRIQPEPRTEDPAVTTALLDALRAGPGAVREAAAYALGRTGGPGAEDALRALLRGGDSEAERVAAAEALGALKSEGALEDLATALRTAESPGVRRAAAAALGALGRPEAVGPLAAALDDRDPFVQRQAQQSLEQSPVSRESLARGLLNKSPRVRLTAVRQAGKANDPELVRPLIGALADADTDVRQAAIAALGAYRDPASLDLLARAARSESAEPANNRLTQFGALSVLATIPDLKAFKVVLALAQESSDPTLRVEALGALGTQLQWLRKAAGSTAVRDPEMKKALDDAAIVSLTAAKHDSVAVRRAATGALAAFPEGQKRLQEMAKLDQSPEVRSAAIERLNRAATRKE